MRKTSLIIIALALLACLVVLRSRPEKPVTASVSATSRGPSFEVHVEKPLLNRPFWELPAALLGVPAHGPRFDHTAPGAHIGSVGPGRLELSADGWDLLIETDGKGGVASGTRLVFPIELAEKQRKLRCRPADRPPVISAPLRRRIPTRSTAPSSSNSPTARMPRLGGSSTGRRHRSRSAGASRACHQNCLIRFAIRRLTSACHGLAGGASHGRA